MSDPRGCPICGGDDLHTFLELRGMPAQDGVVHPTPEAALAAPMGDIRLAICRRCHYIGNLAFDPDKVRFVAYDYAQHHSEQYRKHVDDLVARLVERHDLRGRTLLDVGCGEGFFLSRLCQAGDNRGVGIDPSLRNDDEVDVERLTLIKDPYSEAHAHHRGDLVSCRHVIDELPDPRGFLERLTSALAPHADAVLYVELPDAARTFERQLIWNIGYAKRSWFTAASLETLLRLCGLTVLRTERIFGGEYLGIEGRRATGSGSPDPFPDEPVEPWIDGLDRFARHLESEIERWTRRVAEMRERRETMVLWGAGMRGINFLSRLGDETVFPAIVDVNPNRQGRYLPGSGFRVDEPASLAARPPGRVLITNPTYEAEIRRQLEEMGVRCAVECL